MQNIAPPEATIDAFRDVQAASADKERSVNEAQAYFNEVTQRAGRPGAADHQGCGSL